MSNASGVKSSLVRKFATSDGFCSSPMNGRSILALTIIDRQFAEPGTEVSVVWGEHPGAGTSPDADLSFPHIRATVAPAPYDAHARTQYRRS